MRAALEALHERARIRHARAFVVFEGRRVGPRYIQFFADDARTLSLDAPEGCAAGDRDAWYGMMAWMCNEAVRIGVDAFEGYVLASDPPMRAGRLTLPWNEETLQRCGARVLSWFADHDDACVNVYTEEGGES